MMTDEELAAIDARFAAHYARGLSEPIGLPRAQWITDTAALLADIKRLRAYVMVCEELERLRVQHLAELRAAKGGTTAGATEHARGRGDESTCVIDA